jgi:opacity protein-like surface antigen
MGIIYATTGFIAFALLSDKDVMLFIKKNTCTEIMLLMLTLCCIDQSAFASSCRSDDTSYESCSDDYDSLDDIPLVVMISAGPAFASTGETQTFFLQSDIQNTYITNNKTELFGTGELFVGLQSNLQFGKSFPSVGDRFKGQLGLALAGSSAVGTSGTILRDADPEFNNFNYSYQISQARLTLKGRLLAEMNPTTPFFQAYLSGGLGVGLNRASNYEATPIIFEAVPAPAFSDNNSTAFTYTLGIGVQKSIDTHWQAGIGYEFADWGTSSLGRAPGQTLNSGLRVSHLYTNELQFSLSYVA